jgi:hypothetical protein
MKKIKLVYITRLRRYEINKHAQSTYVENSEKTSSQQVNSQAVKQAAHQAVNLVTVI